MNVVRLIILIVGMCLPLTAAAADPANELIKTEKLRKALESLRENRADEAAEIIAAFRHDSLTLGEYHFTAARVRLAERKLPEAVEHFGRAYQYAPSGPLKETALLERAETYLKMRYYYEARSGFNLFVKHYPASLILDRAYFGLAQCLTETGALKESLSYFDRAGSGPAVILAKAAALHRLGMTAEAAKLYASLPAAGELVSRMSDDGLYYRGENSRLSGRTAEAQKYLSLVKGQLFKPKADLSLGLIALQQGKRELAVKYIGSAASSGDRDAARQALLALADLDTKEGKTAEARAKLEEIRFKYPYGREYDEAVLKLARLQRQEGSYEQAAKTANELTFKSPLRKEAVDELEKIVGEARTKDRELFLKIWTGSGRMLLDSAREPFLLEIARDLRPSGKSFVELMQYIAKYGTETGKARSTLLLAEYYAEKKETGKAEEQLRKLKTMKHAAEDVTRLEALLAYQGRDYKTASDKLLQMKKLQPGEMAMLGGIVASGQDDKRAVARYEKAVKEAGGDAQTYVRLGDIMYGQGRAKEALEYYRLAIGKEARHDWALYRIGMLSGGAEAEEALRKVSRQDRTLSRLAETRLMEMELAKKGADEFR